MLNGKESEGVGDEAKRRVRAAVSQLGYMPNAAGTALRRGHSDVVLILLDPSFVGDVSEHSLLTTVAALTGLGHTVVTHTVTSEPEAVKVARSLQPRGVVLFAFVTARTYGELRTFGAGRVFGIPPVDDPSTADRPWERAIGRAQLRHVVACGHERVLYAFPEPSARLVIAEHRLRGVRDECRSLGLPEPRVFTLPLTRSGAVTALSNLPEARGAAVCAADDRHGLAVLAAAADLGWSVPSDVAVIGAEDTVESRLSVPALTSVRLLESERTEDLRDWVEAALNGRETTSDGFREEHGVSPEVVARGST
ncbi:substrate-binding domain-containing protein [Streptomyces sp. NPDC088157]|uniref:substrate-binding domain-containing protein n=1 Tax=Streptomyces sp. NPDC088157 TaxID=3365832 RepID=UPI0038067AD4